MEHHFTLIQHLRKPKRKRQNQRGIFTTTHTRIIAVRRKRPRQRYGRHHCQKVLHSIQNKQRKCTGIQGRIYRKRLANKTKHSFGKLRTFWMSQSNKHFPGNGMARKLRKA